MTTTETATATARYRADAVHGFVVAILERLAVPAEDARLAADALLAADITGVDSHGVARFAGHPSYVPGLRKGLVNPQPKPAIVHQAAATALYDGDGGMGVVVASRAMQVAIEKAAIAGVGMVSVTNSRHYGIAAHYARMALPHGMIGISMTNAYPQVVQPGGAKATMGTNPIAIAAPSGDDIPFVLDIASSVGAAGKAEIALRQGKEMPEGWLVDGTGQSTMDPATIFTGGGALLPLGSFAELSSHKGYGLAVAVDILCGVLSGAGYSQVLDPAGWSTGHFLAAIRIDAFRPAPLFRGMMDAMLRDLRNAPRVPGVDRMYVHGEKEVETERDRRANGIPLHPAVVASLRGLEPDLGVPFPAAIGA
jgi:LDH2 family malate/lactate/ureidoglycolate dehydrogenase